MLPPFFLPMGFNEILKRLRRINLVNLTADAMVENPLPAIVLNRAQMMEGKGKDGGTLGRYVDDPYFAGRPKQAEAYERYKAKITPQTPRGVRNFFINGYTHSLIKLEVVGQGYRMVANVPWGTDIQNKTGNQALGLTQESREYLWSKIWGPVVKRKFATEFLK